MPRVGQPLGQSDAAKAAAKAAEPSGVPVSPVKKTEAKTSATTPVVGFNPSPSIDPDTHMVVLTVKDDNGKTLVQIPNKQQLAAYKSEAEAAKASR